MTCLWGETHLSVFHFPHEFHLLLYCDSFPSPIHIAVIQNAWNRYCIGLFPDINANVCYFIVIELKEKSEIFKIRIDAS